MKLKGLGSWWCICPLFAPACVLDYTRVCAAGGDIFLWYYTVRSSTIKSWSCRGRKGLFLNLSLLLPKSPLISYSDISLHPRRVGREMLKVVLVLQMETYVESQKLIGSFAKYTVYHYKKPACQCTFPQCQGFRILPSHIKLKICYSGCVVHVERGHPSSRLRGPNSL